MFPTLKQFLVFMNVVVLVFTGYTVRGHECDGTGKSERIITRPLKSVYMPPGNQANLVWKWCIAVNSSVTGIVIYRSSSRNQKLIIPVLTMDLSKNVYYKKDKSRHELSSILNQTKFQERTAFIINNVSKADSGTYILCVRREGIRDLQSEVQIVINITAALDYTHEPRFTLPTTERARPWFTETNFERNDQSVVYQSYRRNLILGVVLSILFVVAIMVFIVIVVIKRKKNGDGDGAMEIRLVSQRE